MLFLGKVTPFFEYLSYFCTIILFYPYNITDKEGEYFIDYIRMETKKAKAADLDSGRTTWFLLGLILVLSIIFVSFEYTSRDKTTETTDSDTDINDIMNDVALTPVSSQDKDMVALTSAPSARKAPVKADRFKVVDNSVAAQTVVQLAAGQGDKDAEGGAAPDARKGNEDETQALSPVGTDMKDNPLNFRIVEDLPKFPGGAVEFMKWLTKNLRYPYAAQQQKIQGKVVVVFIINKDGSVSDLKVAQSLSPDCDREALRVMRMMPKWKPGIQNDKPCRTMVSIPIIFKL